VHANFISNLGGATAADVLALMEEARVAVKAATQTQLVAEVRLLGRKA
jgi:UDP-N-acetylmuramate dehydrogenase